MERSRFSLGQAVCVTSRGQFGWIVGISSCNCCYYVGFAPDQSSLSRKLLFSNRISQLLQKQLYCICVNVGAGEILKVEGLCEI